MIFVQLIVSACALPEVEGSTHASDAGAPRMADQREVRSEEQRGVVQPDAAVAAAPEEPPVAVKPQPQAPDKMTASDAGVHSSASVMPPVQNCRIEPAPRDATQTIWVLVDGSGSMVEQQPKRR